MFEYYISDKIFLRTDVCDDHSSNDKSPGGASTRASSQNSRVDSEIKRTMKSAQTGVVRQLKQETRATQLLFVSDPTQLLPQTLILSQPKVATPQIGNFF